MNKEYKLKNAEELEKLGYEYYEDDGISVFEKVECIPDRINTEYVEIKKISIHRLPRKVFISRMRKNALLTENIDYDYNSQYLDKEELDALIKIYNSLGW